MTKDDLIQLEKILKQTNPIRGILADAAEVALGKVLFHVVGKIRELKAEYGRTVSTTKQFELKAKIEVYQDLLKRLGG